MSRPIHWDDRMQGIHIPRRTYWQQVWIWVIGSDGDPFQHGVYFPGEADAMQCHNAAMDWCKHRKLRYLDTEFELDKKTPYEEHQEFYE